MGRKKDESFLINSNRIRELLERRKLTQSDLAVAIGYTRETVNRYLKQGIVRNSILIKKVADFLEVEPAYISDNYKALSENILDNYKAPHENLNNLSSDQLRNISKVCNEILQKRSTEKEDDELKKVKEKYEGKFILVDDVLFYIIKFKTRFWYEYYSFDYLNNKLSHPEIKTPFIHGESGWLFVDEHPRKTIVANKKRSVPVDRARIILQDEAERIIDEMFSNIKNQMFQNKND